MKASDFLKARNEQIISRYQQLKVKRIPSYEAKQQISKEFGDLSISTIDQIIYNKKYSNSPLEK
ncbi:hypothetical protein AM493_04605 [Flavobacterium akiainvivens]|uniref:Uncharacterized protein n=1 Tax=Flavobacterium akiainvivens TaxID=1202724 RepID=A0A0M8M816_9FLAO|nr:hypothetical protein [Flavobacterium akiainvivens]KOS05393.1 hypothetical protein AM493_04605 [Flavobacterium akiainvivens]SFQ73729.1 hypothetical protein SAMN05444144_11929 [Flavobacterium akiainvivens]